MELLNFRGYIVGIDTAPIIYFLEEHPVWLERVKPFFHELDSGLFQAVTSTLTLTEVLVQPLRQARPELADQYRRVLLNARNLKTLPVSATIAQQAAELRSRYSLRTPDAVQLATAIQSGAEYFLTNDKRLRVTEPMRIITVEELPIHSAHP